MSVPVLLIYAPAAKASALFQRLLFSTIGEKVGVTAMKKSRLIAQCLLKAGMVPTVADGEFLVELNFRKHFPDHQYPYWNLHVNQDFDELLPELRRQEHSVDIRQLIEALW